MSAVKVNYLTVFGLVYKLVEVSLFNSHSLCSCSLKMQGLVAMHSSASGCVGPCLINF